MKQRGKLTNISLTSLTSNSPIHSPLNSPNLSALSSPRNKNSYKAIPDNEGWAYLETSLMILNTICKSYGSLFSIYIDDELIELIYKSIEHENRFAREIGFNTIKNIILCADDVLITLSDKIVNYLCKGLEDNWSQVRFASSKATKQFLKCCKENNKLN